MIVATVRLDFSDFHAGPPENPFALHLGSSNFVQGFRACRLGDKQLLQAYLIAVPVDR